MTAKRSARKTTPVKKAGKTPAKSSAKSIGNNVGKMIDDAQARVNELFNKIDQERGKQYDRISEQFDRLRSTAKDQVDKSRELGKRLREMPGNVLQNGEQQAELVRQRIEQANEVVLDSRAGIALIQAEIRLLQLAREQTAQIQSSLEQFESQLQNSVIAKEGKMIARSQQNVQSAASALKSLPAKAAAKVTSKKAAKKSAKKTAKKPAAKKPLKKAVKKAAKKVSKKR